MEERQVYYIPTNYTESGKFIYGMVAGRNLLEMLIVGIPLSLILYGALAEVSSVIRLLVLIIVVLPVCIFFAAGIDDGSVFQYLTRIFRYVFSKKNYHMERLNYVELKKEDEGK